MVMGPDSKLNEAKWKSAPVGKACPQKFLVRAGHKGTFEERIDDIRWFQTLLTMLCSEMVGRAFEAKEVSRKVLVHVEQEVYLVAMVVWMI